MAPNSVGTTPSQPTCGERTARLAGRSDAGPMDLHITRAGIVLPVRADPAGITGPTPDQARGPRCRTTSPGRFTRANIVVTTEQRIVEAAVGLPPGAAITGWAALHWTRTRWFDGRARDGSDLPVPVAVNDACNLARRPWHRHFRRLAVRGRHHLGRRPADHPPRSLCHLRRSSGTKRRGSDPDHRHGSSRRSDRPAGSRGLREPSAEPTGRTSAATCACSGRRERMVTDGGDHASTVDGSRL